MSPSGGTPLPTGERCGRFSHFYNKTLKLLELLLQLLGNKINYDGDDDTNDDTNTTDVQTTLRQMYLVLLIFSAERPSKTLSSVLALSANSLGKKPQKSYFPPHSSEISITNRINRTNEHAQPVSQPFNS